MKAVKITHISKEKSMYKVYLGNGTVHQFTRERNAKDFLGATNKFLTQRLYEARDMYGAVWGKYHCNWGYFENNTPGKGLYHLDRQCKQLLENCESQFSLLVHRAGYTNGNYFVFKQFYYIINSLLEVLNHVSYVANKKSVAMELYALDSLFRRLKILDLELNNYAKDGACSVFKMPMHINMAKEFTPAEEHQLKIA